MSISAIVPETKRHVIRQGELIKKNFEGLRQFFKTKQFKRVRLLFGNKDGTFVSCFTVNTRWKVTPLGLPLAEILMGQSWNPLYEYSVPVSTVSSSAHWESQVVVLHIP
jgi:hypothetical protein